MSLTDINKRYIDDVLEYFIKEIYSWQWFEQKSGREKYGKIDIEAMLGKRLEDLNKKDFVIDWRVNVNLRTKAEIRAAKLEGLLDGVEDEGSFIEVLYPRQEPCGVNRFSSIFTPPTELASTSACKGRLRASASACRGDFVQAQALAWRAREDEVCVALGVDG